MDRLTTRDGEFIKWKGCPLYEMGPAEIYTMAERLAAYEDSGLIPEGCAQAAEANQLMAAFGLPMERIVELLKAEIDGRCAILQRKVGETAWFTQSAFRQAVEPIEAVVLCAANHGGAGLTYTTRTVNGGLQRKFTSGQIGRTVFYTREDAEKAMEGQAWSD